MASPKQIQANRQNAKKSTGPTSEEGKQRVSRNALKHGLLGKETLLPWEDDAEFVQLRENLKGDLNPVGELEIILFDRIISQTWRLKRAKSSKMEFLLGYKMLKKCMVTDSCFQPFKR